MTYGCAFCGEENELFLDESGGRRQTFTEDCAVCCRPNLITLTFDDDGDAEIEVIQEYEA
ncbi:MAG TPA: CPXCG motif-containing cysteine-rich protein [Methylomirabilota bacterium]|nr:CPXCG motif-containing cysteine-rich protein [Methylomirabilota bacterium]